jgi:hypothetical protein
MATQRQVSNKSALLAQFDAPGLQPEGEEPSYVPPNGNTGVSGMGGGGNKFGVVSSYDISHLSDGQRQQMLDAQQAHRDTQSAGFARDTEHLKANGGQYAPGYQSQWNPSADLSAELFGGIPRNGNTGTSGYMPGGQEMPPLQQDGPAPSPAPKPGGLGQFAGKLEGFDSGKLNSEHNSPKYAFGRTMSQFDPKGGITQEMLDALNGLGMGTVSGKLGGDKISIGGNVDPRFEGVTEFDIIRDLENGGGWQWGGLNGPAAAAEAAQGAQGGGNGLTALLANGALQDSMGGSNMQGIHPLLQGDALQDIGSAFAQFQEPTANLRALLAQLRG